MNTKRTFKIAEDVGLTCIFDNSSVRFKKNLFSINLLVPLTPETASVNALVTKILVNSCKKFPNFTLFNKKLEEIYGASISSDVQKVGETQVLSFYATFINEKFAFDETQISTEICEILCDVIFEPNVSSNEFEKSVFEQEKRQLIEQIEAEFNNKQSYAIKRCTEVMCENEKFGTNKLGSIESAKKITNKAVFRAWKNLLKSAKVEAMLIGNIMPETIVGILKEKFSKVSRTDICECQTEIISKVENTREVTDQMAVTQSKLVMGFRTGGTAEPSDDVMAMQVMTMIFGGTPYSKLFLNVREKMSLCYYCSAAYNKFKGIIMVSSGVEPSNIEKAKSEILNQLSEIQSGNVTENEITQTKESMIQSAQKVRDSIFKIENFEILQKISNKSETIESLIAKIRSVTKEQIVTCAKLVKLDTVYILTEGGTSQV